MPYTYSDNPVAAGTAAQKRDAVRFLIQDTDVAFGKVTDAEIAFALTENANCYAAAAAICDTLAVRAGNVSSRSVDDTSVSYTADFYKDLSAKLWSQAKSGYETPFCGGISVADKATTETDSDRTPSDFTRGMFENPAAESVTTLGGS